jgi:hypothetical protein
MYGEIIEPIAEEGVHNGEIYVNGLATRTHVRREVLQFRALRVNTVLGKHSRAVHDEPDVMVVNRLRVQRNVPSSDHVRVLACFDANIVVIREPGLKATVRPRCRSAGLPGKGHRGDKKDD